MASSFNLGIMSRLTEQLKQRGFQYFDWNVSSGDAGTKEYSMNDLEPFVIWALENGYIFLPLDSTSPRIQHKVYN